MDSNKYSLLFVHELENVAQSKTPAKGRRQNRKSRKFGTMSQSDIFYKGKIAK